MTPARPNGLPNQGRVLARFLPKDVVEIPGKNSPQACSLVRLWVHIAQSIRLEAIALVGRCSGDHVAVRDWLFRLGALSSFHLTRNGMTLFSHSSTICPPFNTHRFVVETKMKNRLEFIQHWSSSLLHLRLDLMVPD